MRTCILCQGVLHKYTLLAACVEHFVLYCVFHGFLHILSLAAGEGIAEFACYSLVS